MFTVQPSNVTVGAAITPAVQVTAQDAQGNTAVGFSGSNVTVAISTNPSGGILSGTRTVAAVKGVATFTDLSIDKAGTGYQLFAGASGLVGATSTSFSVAQGPATRLTFIVQPSNASANQPITPAVQLALQDALGHTISSFAANVYIKIGHNANPAGGTLSGSGELVREPGTITVAAVGGVATFPDLSIDLAGTGYTLFAWAGTSSPDSVVVLPPVAPSTATSAPFNVTCITNCWTSKDSMPTPRTGLAVGVLNGVPYAVGGFARGIGASATVEAYDPSTNSWTTKAPMLSARADLAVGVVNGVLYAVGGVSAKDSDLAKVEAYDPVTNTWTTKAPMPTARSRLGVGVVNGILYAVGGLINTSGQPTNEMDAYDPATNTWTSEAPMPTTRSALGVGVANGEVFAVGGFSTTYLATLEAYDPAANTWSSKASMPTARFFLGVGVMNNILYAVAGVGASCECAGSPLEAYDATTNTWTSKAPLPTGGSRLGVGVLNGILYAIGGAGSYFAPTGSNEAYQP